MEIDNHLMNKTTGFANKHAKINRSCQSQSFRNTNLMKSHEHLNQV